MSVSRWGWLATVGVVALVAAGASGCGSDSSDGSSAESDQAMELRIARERKDAADKAVQKERLKELQQEVDRLRKGHKTKTVVVPGAPASKDTGPVAAASTSGETRTFHVPSGNVSCEIAGGGARCTVAKIGTTFVLPADGRAFTEGGGLARGSGSLVEFGSVVTAGGITCDIPAENEPRGIQCKNASGHGFEASAVSSRQQTY